MKVAVVTMTSPSRKEMFDFTYENQLRYCDRHGYSSYAIHVEDEAWAYRKHEVFATLFALGYNLIFFKDDDSLISNLSVPIESFIDEEHDWYVTKDFNEINCGMVIIKNTEWAQRLNDAILARKDIYENEQNVFNEMYRSPQINDMVKILKHPSINSYMYSLYKECSSHVGKPELGDWAEGQFLLHVPALPIEKRLEVLKSVKVIE